MPRPTTSNYASKWATFSAASLILLTSGGMQYTFSLYASDLKQKYHLSQTRLAGLGTALNVGAACLALPAGLFYDAMVARRRRRRRRRTPPLVLPRACPRVRRRRLGAILDRHGAARDGGAEPPGGPRGSPR